MAANPMRGEAPLGEHVLVYTFNAMCALERATGMKTADLLELMRGGMSFDDIRHFAWAGLLERHEEMTLREAGEIVGDVGPEAALTAISEAIAACFSAGKAKKKAKGANPPKAA